MLDAGRELVEPCKAKAHGRQGLVPRRVRALCQEAALNVEHFVPMLARVGGHSSHSFVPPALGHHPASPTSHPRCPPHLPRFHTCATC